MSSEKVAPPTTAMAHSTPKISWVTKLSDIKRIRSLYNILACTIFLTLLYTLTFFSVDQGFELHDQAIIPFFAFVNTVIIVANTVCLHALHVDRMVFGRRPSTVFGLSRLLVKLWTVAYICAVLVNVAVQAGGYWMLTHREMYTEQREGIESMLHDSSHAPVFFGVLASAVQAVFGVVHALCGSPEVIAEETDGDVEAVGKDFGGEWMDVDLEKK